MKIYEQFGSREMIDAIYRIGSAKYESFHDYIKKHGLADITQIAVLFEGIGIFRPLNRVILEAE